MTAAICSGLPQPELLRRLTIHQRVIEEAMERGDVLPARFGTVLASEDEVRSFLTRWGGPFRESLARFSGLVEVEVAATWDLGRTLARLAAEPEVVAAKAEAEQARAGRAFRPAGEGRPGSSSGLSTSGAPCTRRSSCRRSARWRRASSRTPC